jgi:toxin ParE1/3/4
MPNVRYSKKANTDLEDIAAFTFEKWGNDQAERYVDDLYGVCRLIAQQPEMGRSCGAGHPKLRRIEHESHVILYSTTSSSGIIVQRIMHKAQLLP